MESSPARPGLVAAEPCHLAHGRKFVDALRRFRHDAIRSLVFADAAARGRPDLPLLVLLIFASPKMTPKRKPASSPVETEAKIRVAAFPRLRTRLKAAGGRRVAERTLESNALFDWPSGSLRAAGKSFRVRRYGASGSITLKGVAQVTRGLKSRMELESEVSAPEMMEWILSSLGFEPQFRYEKFREVWKVGRALVCLDETPAGRFVEIEGNEGVIHRLAVRLGLDPSQFLSDSYPAIWAASRGRGDMVFARTRGRGLRRAGGAR